jgi:fibronectin-binding autotransporter adhesin
MTDRQVQFLAKPATGNSFNRALLQNDNTNPANNWVISQNLANTTDRAHSLELRGSNTGANEFAGALINSTNTPETNTLSIINVDAGNWSLSNASNTFTGSITLGQNISGSDTRGASNGTLSYASAGGSNPITFNLTSGSATLNYTGATAKTMSGAITASALTTGTITLGSTGSGAINYSNTASLGTTGSGIKNLILSGTNTGENILAGQWVNNTSGAATLTKSGAGTWILTNTNNTYSGATNVSEGKLLVNGTTTASAFTVASGATLGGTGTIGGAVNVSGVLSPGASIESLRTGALTMASGSTFVYEVANETATGADMLGVNGALSLTGVNLSLDLATIAALSLPDTTWAVGDKLTLISYGDTAITSGFVGYTDDTNYTFGSNVWTFNYNDTSAGANFASDLTGLNRITLTAFTVVPEPSTALLTALGVLALLRRRR